MKKSIHHFPENSAMRNKSANVLERLRSMTRYELSPEEKNLLGIDEQDIKQMHNEPPQMVKNSVEDIVTEAYKNVPEFRKAVQEDVARNPERLEKTPGLVAGFLRHLKSMLPPEKTSWITSNTFRQAHDLIKTVLQKELQKEQDKNTPAPEKGPVFEPLKPGDLDLFTLDFSSLSKKGKEKYRDLKLRSLDPSRFAQVKENDVLPNILYFLGKLKGPDGKAVKNKDTKDMSDDEKVKKLESLLAAIREAKIKAGTFNRVDEKWLGKNPREVTMHARSLALPKDPKEPTTYQNKFNEVAASGVRVLSLINRVFDMLDEKGMSHRFKGSEGESLKGINVNDKIVSAVNELNETVDSCIPSVYEVDEKLDAIRQEAQKLGLSEKELGQIIDLDAHALYVKSDISEKLEMVRDRIKGVQRQIDKGKDDESLKKILEASKKKEEFLSELAQKDFSALEDAMSSYLKILKESYTKANQNLRSKNVGQYPELNTFIETVHEIGRQFSRLSKETEFKNRWGTPGDKSRKEEGDAQEEPQQGKEKTAGKKDGISAFTKAVEKYRGESPKNSFEDALETIYHEEGLKGLQERILSIIEAGPDNKYNPTGTDYRGNILKGKPPALEDMVKAMTSLRANMNNMMMSKKMDGLNNILAIAAEQVNKIKSSGASKTAFWQKIRKAAEILSAAEGTEKKPKRVQKTEGTPGQYREPSKANWFIYRERLTKYGKKYLENYFDKPDSVAKLVEALEEEHLNNMYLEGGDISEDGEGGKPVGTQVEEALKRAVQKVTHKDLDRWLESGFHQQLKTEQNIKRIRKDKEEAEKRLDSLNEKIVETQKENIPKLESFAKFLSDPLTYVKKGLERKKKEKAEKREESQKKQKSRPAVTFEPKEVGKDNFQQVLFQLSRKYVPESALSKTASEFRKFLSVQAHIAGYTSKKAATARELPSSLYKEISDEFALPGTEDWDGTRAKRLYEKTIGTKEPYQRAQQVANFYGFVLLQKHKLDEYFRSGIESELDADWKTLRNLQIFLDSDEVKSGKVRPELAKKAKDTAALVSDHIKKEQERLEAVRKLRKDIAYYADRMDIIDELKKIKKDLSDKKVDRLYEVATSPEMNPDKKDRESIRKKQKDKEKGLSFIIDRDTYKRNMNKITTHTLKGKSLKLPTGDITPVTLGSNRLKEFEEQRDKWLEGLRQKRQYVSWYELKDEFERMIKNLEDFKKSVKAIEPNLESLEALRDNFKHLAELREAGPVPEKDVEILMEALSKWLSPRNLMESTSGPGGDKNPSPISDDFIKNWEKTLKDSEKKEFDRVIKAILSDLNTLIKSQKNAFNLLRNQISDFENRLPKLKDELQKTEQGVVKPDALSNDKKRLEERLQKLKVDLMANPTTHGMTTSQRAEREKQIKSEIADIEKKLSGMKKTAGTGEPGQEKTPYEWALDNKGTKPAPFMKDLPKFEGWDILENFLQEAKRERKYLEEYKLKGEDWDKIPEEERVSLAERLEDLDRLIPAVDEYKKMLVKIGDETVPLQEVVERFESLMHNYQNELRRYKTQRDETIERLKYLRQDLDFQEQLFDEDGKFKGLSEEEKTNIRNMFYRMLYKQLEGYWAERVGQRLSVLGERDTDWYNTVYNVFKSMSNVRSNRKFMGIMNALKQETRSEMDDLVNRKKLQELENQRDELKERYTELGGNPEKNEFFHNLNVRISTLKKKEKQLDKLFKEMGEAVTYKANAEIKEGLGKLAPEVEPESDVDLEEKAKKEAEEAIDEFAEQAEELGDIQNLFDDLSQNLDLGTERVKKLQKNKKTAYSMEHPDFNPRVYYSRSMQKKIASLIESEAKKSATKKAFVCY